jgi:hypothetical protein
MDFDDKKYAQRERLIFLDNCLTWRGVANRSDIIDRFGISNGQAALDFKLYLVRASGAPPVYDNTRKTYVAAPKHHPIAETRLTEAFEAVLGETQDQYPASLPRLERHADPIVISHLYQSIQSGVALNIHYTSMRTGTDAVQWIVPKVFASDGERIHIRAYSYKHDDYHDYVPIRISPDSTFEQKALERPIPIDQKWNTLARIYLKPKSHLSPEQAEAVRREYGFKDELLCIETREALEFYADRRWGLDQPHSRLEREKVEYSDITEGANRASF